MANKKQGRTITVCIVGLSGYDITEKCLFGVGKSCFCNRFVRPSQDEYYPEHTSIFSTSDFVGSVLNNDHFLYWGSVEKTFDENIPITFKVIEQTELIDDASYLPLSKGGQLIPYNKRAVATKLLSPGKIMYISRDQVALQNDYEQQQMDRDGKLGIDAFICCYDVSSQLADKLNHTELQENVLTNLITMIHKTKKPVVVVATKCDESSEQLLHRAHQFVQSRKVSTPLVESSAENSINIDLGFQTIVQLIDTKNRFRPKFISYQEGLTTRRLYTNKLTEKYLNIVKAAATDSSLLMSWSEFKKSHNNLDIYKEFIFKCGSQKARQLFNQQAKKIKQHYEDKKLNEYLNKLPDALDELLPSLQSIEANEWKWENCQQAIKNHILFDKWFLVLPPKQYWNSPEQLFETTDARIPFDVLQVERSRACFDRHIKKLHESARKIRMKTEFRKLLGVTAEIRPGTSWYDASHMLSAEESYKYLDENERKIIFEMYLRDITVNAKIDFQELLFESASKFYKLSKDVRPSDFEMNEIYDYLKHDPRYQNLEYIGNARDILLFNHIALMQSPTRCLSGPDKCMDRQMQQVVECTTRRSVLNPYENDLFRDSEDEQINVLVIGKGYLAQEMENKVKDESSSCDTLEYIVDGQIYGLNLHVLDEMHCNDVDILQRIISEFKPQGYLAIYSNEDSLAFIRDCLQKIQNLDTTPQLSLPLNIIMANQGGLLEEEIELLRNEGRNMANMLECVFVDYPYMVSLMDDPIHDSQVQDAIRGIVDVINKRIRPPATPTGNADDYADIRILLVAMCGDEYPVELILGTMLQPHACYSNPDQQDTIMLEAFLDGTKKTIAVTMASYHRAYSLKNQMFHGYILAYSATRLASLETLRAYASVLPKIPVQVLAVTGSSSGASIIFHEEDPSALFNDIGTGSLSSKLSAKFQNNQKQAGSFIRFFQNVHDKRAETEFLIQGIRKRRQGPLPDVPHNFLPNDLIPNGNMGECTYASINDQSNDDGIYSEVSNAKSQIIDSDSLPSSPDHFRKSDIRSRTSTVDSRDDVINTNNILHDESGLYAIVDKSRKFVYPKTNDHKYSEDEDDDMIWQDNLAYESNTNMSSNNNSSLESPKFSDRPYATVPYLPKGHKSVIQDFNKFATLPPENKRMEPNYASIDLIRSQMAEKRNQCYDPDSLSSVSSKSKESAGSQSDVIEVKVKKTPLPSPMGEKPLFYIQDNDGKWSPIAVKSSNKSGAPIARPDDDENEEIKELRQTLEDTLSTKGKEKESKITDSPSKSTSLRKSRSESSNSTTASLDPRNLNFIKKMYKKVTPNASPGNSDVETDQVPCETPNSLKKHKNRSIRKRKPSPAPLVISTDEDSAQNKDRSNTLPTNESPKMAPKFASLDNRKQKSFIFKKLPEIAGSLALPTDHQEKFTTQTLDRKKSKKIKEPRKVSKDDLDLPLPDSTSVHMDKKKEKQLSKRKQLSMSFKKNQRNKRESETRRRLLEFEQAKTKNQKFKDSKYFGRPLKDICLENSLCPIFVEKVIQHIEDYGIQSEGIYRQSGNKNTIEAIMTKFEENQSIQLHELGVSVHAVTGALKQFFKLLPEPLIPFSCSSEINEIMIIMDAEGRLKKLKELVDNLPEPNFTTFKKFTCHLHRVTKYKQTNKMDVRNLQTVLYPTLMRPNFDSLTNMSQSMNMGLFIQTCIEQAKTIFDYDFDKEEEEKTNTRNFSCTDEQKVLKDGCEGNPIYVEIGSTKDTTVIQSDDRKMLMKSLSNDLSVKIPQDECSFSDSVLKDPGVEIIINSPSPRPLHKTENVFDKKIKETMDQNKKSSENNKVKKFNRKSVETAID